MKGGMAAFPKRRDNVTRAVLGAIEELRAAGRPVGIDTICEVTGRTRDSTSRAIARLRLQGRLPCRIERSPKRDAAYLSVIAAAERLEREGGALSWDRIGRAAGCSAKAAADHASNAKRAGVWRFTVLPKYSLMTKEERSELWMSTRRPRGAAWISEEDVQPMDLDILAEIRASKVDAAKEVEVRVCKHPSYERRIPR